MPCRVGVGLIFLGGGMSVAVGNKPGLPTTCRVERDSRAYRSGLQSRFRGIAGRDADLDSDGVIRDLNPQALAMFGWIRGEMVGARVERLVPAASRRRHRQHRRPLRRGAAGASHGTGLRVVGFAQGRHHNPGRDQSESSELGVRATATSRPTAPTSCGSPTSRMCPPGLAWLYLAVVLDAWSRRIVGWAMAPHMRAELVEGALTMAISNRNPKGRVVHHSVQGSQYTSLAFGKRCREAGVVQSMGSVGDAYDNAMCESFFATLECELLNRSRFPTPADARREVFGFIEGFYNTRRIHSALGYESPTNFERLNHAA